MSCNYRCSNYIIYWIIIQYTYCVVICVDDIYDYLIDLNPKHATIINNKYFDNIKMIMNFVKTRIIN